MNAHRFGRLGKGSVVSPLASIHGAERIFIGKGCRIDDFVVLSAGAGGIIIGDRVHIGCHSTLIGAGRIEIEDGAGISGRVSIYSSGGDFARVGGNGSPCIPEERANARTETVLICRGAVIGCGAVVLPGSLLEEGAVLGALSLLTGKIMTHPRWIYAGVPARYLGMRQ